jgi:ankyrin repeat protein
VLLLLLRRGANPNVRSQSDATPLHIAAKKCHEECALALADAGAAAAAAANSPDVFGLTPLLYAVERCSGSVSLGLLGYGASARALGAAGLSPLLLALELGNSAVAMQLLAAGADPHAAMRETVALRRVTVLGGTTPLLAATRGGCDAAAARLVELGADPFAADEHGSTAVSCVLGLSRPFRLPLRLAALRARAAPLLVETCRAAAAASDGGACAGAGADAAAHSRDERECECARRVRTSPLAAFSSSCLFDRRVWRLALHFAAEPSVAKALGLAPRR